VTAAVYVYSAKDLWRTVSHMKSSTQLFSSETQDFYRHQARTRPTFEPAMDRHAACQRTATADMDPFPILRAGAFVTSLAGVVHSSPSIFLSPTQYTTTRVSFSRVRARYGPTLSAQCACLTARFMPWRAFCVLAYLAPVSSPRSAQLWPCATWVAAATLTCASSSACTRQVSTTIAVSYRVARRDGCSQRRGGGGERCAV